MRFIGRRGVVMLFLMVAFAAGVAVPPAHADNKRLNESVFVNIYTAQKQNGCPTEPELDGRLVELARLHTLDVLNNRALNGDIGSDGSTPQDRANRSGFVGKVSETVAINPALAISGIEILGQWWWNPAYQATMKDCGNTSIGVWSENSLDRSVVVAVYGQPG
ncbi:CAP domain-containing protein [Mycobacterium deserti]|uniref:CAP domain-containing protein n=1 Tax=Mycobacterium deserti TaxID=2978347 RepID=A0ABT2M4A1_9MYCO|nr:CAP domain-containing protein [Mycobacterium deserti]MCT7657093.1 CAP domain-containing protein [Mycobacterium deserti]